jgi:hypothetical protein
MKSSLTTVLTFAAGLMLAPTISGFAQTAKVDPTGTWVWTSPGRDGGQTRTNTMKLKLEGDKLTGTVAGRQQDTEIKEAKIKDGELSFKVTREFQGNSFTQQFTGKISGDTIKGKIKSERDGQAQERDWEAKREAKKAS